MGGPPEVPPGWYPDPGGSPGRRWWDGRAWSQDTRPAQPPNTEEQAGESRRRRRTGWLVALGMVIAAGVGAVTAALLTGESDPVIGEGAAQSADEAPAEPGAEDEPSPTGADSASVDSELMALLDELPYRESSGLPALVVGDLELAWEASSLGRPTDASDWHEGPDDLAEHPFLGANGALPPGTDFIRSVTRLRELDFAELLGFGPVDVDRFAEWHAGSSWAATLRTDVGEAAVRLADHPAWRNVTTDGVEWFERTDEKEEYPNFRDALLVRDTVVAAGPAPDDVDQPHPPAALNEDPRRLSDVPGLPELAAALEGEAVWAWIYHAPPVVDLELEPPSPLPEPYLAGAYASVLGDGGIRPTFVLVHDGEAAASTNAAALERNAANQGEELAVSREQNVVWARTTREVSAAVAAIVRLQFEALDLVAPSG